MPVKIWAELRYSDPPRKPRARFCIQIDWDAPRLATKI